MADGWSQSFFCHGAMVRGTGANGRCQPLGRTSTQLGSGLTDRKVAAATDQRNPRVPLQISCVLSQHGHGGGEGEGEEAEEDEEGEDEE
eukprot:6019963-Pyramimonas_sp.AAC.1